MRTWRRRLRLTFCHPSFTVWDAALSGPCWYGRWNQCSSYPLVFKSTRLCVFCCVFCFLQLLHNLVPRVAEEGKNPPGQLKQGVAMSLSTPFETGLVLIRAPSQADSWHGPYYTVVRLIVWQALVMKVGTLPLLHKNRFEFRIKSKRDSPLSLLFGQPHWV